MTIMDDVLATFERNAGASSEALKAFESTVGFKPPIDYIEFMKRANGGEGPVGERYLMLWPLDELHAHNAGYNVAKFAPGLFLFGSSGGGDAYAFDTRRQPEPLIVAVPFIGMSLASARQYGSSFETFLRALTSET